jgi:hypothetical protein
VRLLIEEVNKTHPAFVNEIYLICVFVLFVDKVSLADKQAYEEWYKGVNEDLVTSFEKPDLLTGTLVHDHSDFVL